MSVLTFDVMVLMGLHPGCASANCKAGSPGNGLTTTCIEVMNITDLDKALNDTGCGWPSPEGSKIGLRTWSADTGLVVTNLTIN